MLGWPHEASCLASKLLTCKQLAMLCMPQVQLVAPFSSADASRSAGASPRDPSAMQPPTSTAAAAAVGVAGAGDPAAADTAEGAAAAPAPVSLEMENARLRAELATQVC
jgi:hypothetical protein